MGPKGLDRLLSQRGSRKVPGGQRRRLAGVRAVGSRGLVVREIGVGIDHCGATQSANFFLLFLLRSAAAIRVNSTFLIYARMWVGI